MILTGHLSRPGMSDHLTKVDGSNIFVTPKYFLSVNLITSTVVSQLDINVDVQVETSDDDKCDT